MGPRLTVVALLASVAVALANPEMTVDLPGGATMDFVWIEPGMFQMGMSQAQEDTLRFGPGGGRSQVCPMRPSLMSDRCTR